MISKRIGVNITSQLDWETEVRRTLAAPQELTTVLEPVTSCTSSELLAIEGLTRSPRVDSRELFARAGALGLDVTLELCTLSRLLDRFAEEETEARLSVNVSPQIVGTPAVQDLLAPWCDRLIIEISEESIVHSPAQLAASLVGLRQRGAEIALDNAGVGYGGLSLLVALEPDWVKLDRRLIASFVASQMSQAVVQTLTTMAHRIGARVVGVGVEHEPQLEALIANDVDGWQGYLEQPFVVHRSSTSIQTVLKDLPVPTNATMTIQVGDSVSLAVGRWLREGIRSLDDIARVSDGCYELGWVRFRDLVGIALSC